MKIGGLQRVSLIDYPGKVCAVVFLQGCNFRCPYCHNPELVDPDRYGDCLAEEELFSFLKKRRGRLDAVTVTGGEPTLHPDLPGFLRRLREMDYLIKIDSNGSRPEVLRGLIEEKLVDFIAMDVKAPLEKYETVAAVPVEGATIKQSIDLILAADIAHEFRTTVLASLLSEGDLLAIGRLVAKARRYTIQRFVPSKILNQSFLHDTAYSDEGLSAVVSILAKDIPVVALR